MTFFSFESEPVPGSDGVKTTEQRLFPVRGRATAQFSNQCLRTGGFYSEFLYIGEQYQEVSCWPVRQTRGLSVPINPGHRPSAKEGTDVTGLLEYSQQFTVVREILVVGTASRKRHSVPRCALCSWTLCKIREHGAICRRLFTQSCPHVLRQAEEHIGGVGIKLPAGSSKNFLPCLFKRKC